jgi:hypothetical protein
LEEEPERPCANYDFDEFYFDTNGHLSDLRGAHLNDITEELPQ